MFSYYCKQGQQGLVYLLLQKLGLEPTCQYFEGERRYVPQYEMYFSGGKGYMVTCSLGEYSRSYVQKYMKEYLVPGSRG